MKKIILIAFVLCAVVLGTRAQQLRMDTHLHVDVPMIKENMPGKDVNLRAAMEKAGMNAIGMTFAVDYVNLTYKGQAYERFMNALDGYDRILKFSNIKLTLNGKEAKENLAKGEPIVIECVEGGHFLEGDVSRLQTAYDRGLRVFCLLHDNDANPPLGDVYTNKPAYGGLTKLGADAIREAERLGMLVDLAHADSTTVMMAIRVATRPILISHTGLNTRLGNSPMAQMMKARLISPAEAKQVADAGGVIGVWPHLASSAREYAENIKAMVNIMGIDHVSIGTDSKITPEVWEKTPEMIAEEERHKKEDEKAGHKMDPAMKKMLEKDPNAVNHVWNDEPLAFYPSVVKALQEVGFNEEEIDKICGGNFLRIFTEATDQGLLSLGLTIS